jgi:hypothetical protein
MQITEYESAKKPNIKSVSSLETILDTIKNGDDKQNLIEAARLVGKNSPIYKTIKTEQLTTFRFNFLFEDSASNTNITAPTGLLYLDADDVEKIPDSDYILAKWRSLSNTGYGMLVKVEGLTLDNFKETYNSVSHIIGIDSDAYARKATQQTILSYDPELYYNPSSITYKCNNIENPSHVAIKKKGEHIEGHEVFLNIDVRTDTNIRFDNIDDYFTDDTPFIVFTKKVKICKPYLKPRIEKGQRNSIMFFLLSQYSLLNPSAGESWLIAIANSINDKMYPKLLPRELNSTVNSVIKGRANKTLELHYNEERRILFNPKVNITLQEKMQIVNTELGHLKILNTLERVNIAIDNWDFETDGKITQAKLAIKAKRGEKTIQRHWKHFKAHVKKLNALDIEKPTEIITPIDEPKKTGISIKQYMINMKCKFLKLDDVDEAVMRKQFWKGNINYVTDDGFRQIHEYMIEHLKRKYDYATQ